MCNKPKKQHDCNNNCTRNKSSAEVFSQVFIVIVVHGCKLRKKCAVARMDAVKEGNRSLTENGSGGGPALTGCGFAVNALPAKATFPGFRLIVYA